jgi:PAS domain S-box-containing protein
MDPRASALAEPVTASEHHLKAELYSLVKANSEIFEFLQAGSLDGIWYLDLENPGQGWMSERYKTIFGYADHEIPNTSLWWRGNIFPEDLPATLDNFARHCADPNVPFDQIIRHRHKNGSTVWVRCRGFAIRDACGKPIRMLGAHTDITDLKRTEHRLRALYEASSEMSFVADLETGVITECNQAFRENTGQSQMSTTTFMALCETQSVSAAEGILQSLKNNMEVKDVELNLKRRQNDSTFSILVTAQTADSDTGRPALRAWCRDISHLKRFANLEVLIGALASGILLSDERGLICATNPAADRMFGYQKGELNGRRLDGLLTEPPHAEKHGLRKDGSVFPVHLEFSSIQLGEGVFKTATIADLTARKGIETALRESEHRFRQLTESLPQLVWTCAPDGTCDYLSPQWVEFTGVPEAEQLELGWLHQVHPDDRGLLVSTWSASVRNTNAFQFEYRLRRHDGIYRWFDTRGIPLRDADTRIVKWFGTCTDITERRYVEDDQHFLIQLSAQLQATASVAAIAANVTRLMAEHFQSARCVLYVTGPDHDQLKLLHEHRRQSQLSESSHGSLMAWGNQDLKSKLILGQTVAVDNTASHSYTISNYQELFHPADIEAFIAVPMRRSGRLVCVLCLFVNTPRRWSQREIHLAQTASERIWLGYEASRALTAERAINETLAASEQRLQLALQSAAIGIWETDTVANTNTWDARSRAIFGFPADLVINGEIVLNCVHPDDREAVQQSVQTHLDPGASGHFQTDYRIIAWNGTGIRHVYAQGQWFYEGEGEHRRPVRAIGTVQDVTALKRGEQALRRANMELEQFAYAAAHDLQEPLRNVGLATQILANRYQGKFDPDADNLLRTAVDGPMRMQAMVKDLLAYSRAVLTDEDTVLLADPGIVLALALKNLGTSIAETQAQVTWDDFPRLRMSETHLLQLLQNLVGNSVKYSGDQPPQIHVGTVRRAGECVFFVKDCGIGIAPEYHQRAFGVFKRLHKKDIPGTGIGLALCKRIVEHYGGRIWIESAEGQGTTVLFTPPLAETESSQMKG